MDNIFGVGGGPSVFNMILIQVQLSGRGRKELPYHKFVRKKISNCVDLVPDLMYFEIFFQSAKCVVTRVSVLTDLSRNKRVRATTFLLIFRTTPLFMRNMTKL